MRAERCSETPLRHARKRQTANTLDLSVAIVRTRMRPVPVERPMVATIVMPIVRTSVTIHVVATTPVPLHIRRHERAVVMVFSGMVAVATVPTGLVVSATMMAVRMVAPAMIGFVAVTMAMRATMGLAVTVAMARRVVVNDTVQMFAARRLPIVAAVIRVGGRGPADDQRGDHGQR